MSSNFIIQGLNPEPYQSLFTQTPDSLKRQGIRKLVVAAYPGYPCRVSLQDASLGEEVLLMPYAHHAINSPYQASGPIYVRQNVPQRRCAVNEIPEILAEREVSLRAYDAKGMMRDACVLQGKIALTRQIHLWFTNEKIAYLQVHNAAPGCFYCQIDRAL